jgi:hypothetical protein
MGMLANNLKRYPGEDTKTAAKCKEAEAQTPESLPGPGRQSPVVDSEASAQLATPATTKSNRTYVRPLFRATPEVWIDLSFRLAGVGGVSQWKNRQDGRPLYLDGKYAED